VQFAFIDEAALHPNRCGGVWALEEHVALPQEPFSPG
jgi:hypothetical protein